MVDNKKRSVGTKESPEYIKKLIIAEARKQGVPVELALAVAQQESGFNNVAVSKPNKDGSRDHGVMQLNDRYHKLKNVYDPVENIRYGVGMLREGLKRNNGNVQKTLSDYNAGPNARGEGRAKGDAYALKVMTLANRFSPQNINNMIASNATSVTGAAAPVEDISMDLGDRIAKLQQGGLSEGEDIYNKYIKDAKLDTKLYEDLRTRKQQEAKDAVKEMNSLPLTASEKDVQDIMSRYQQARQDVKDLYNIGINAVQSGIGPNQIDAYYNKLAQADEQRIQRMQEANPYTQMGQKAPLNLDDYARAVNRQQQTNAMIRANNIAMGGQANPVDFAGEAQQLAQARQAAEIARQTGLTPEQFLQGQMLNYNNMGTTFNNQQQVMLNLVQAAYQGDRQAQQLLANMYTAMGSNLGTIASQEQQAIRQANADALARARYLSENTQWGVQQGQTMDAIPVQGDINFQQNRFNKGVDTINQGASRGQEAANTLANYESMLQKAAMSGGQQDVQDPYKAVKDYNTMRLNALGMSPNVTPEMLNQAIQETKFQFAQANPAAAGILYPQATNYSQFTPGTIGQSTMTDKTRQ